LRRVRRVFVFLRVLVACGGALRRVRGILCRAVVVVVFEIILLD
jgi:hypothetical protein